MSAADRHQRLSALFAHACDLPKQELEVFLERACPDDPSLLAELRALIAGDSAAAFIDEPIPVVEQWRSRVNALPETTSPRPGEGVGDTIGCYRLLEILGEGGFGVVYLAERTAPHTQRVALKILKPGMDSRAIVARFEQERQALAVMEHPNIARVFDAGTTDRGRPYFVMELVAGEPITAYCDRCRLDTRRRLELFIPVCEAVQHAHTKGVIHRDLKPSNILVARAGEGGQPIPKIIDFGIAKAIGHAFAESLVVTQTGQVVGTPAYMSPEQAGGRTSDIDTRTDVYALGVILYELLTGSAPIDPTSIRTKSLDEIQRMIREVDPPRPSVRVRSRSNKSRPRAGSPGRSPATTEAPVQVAANRGTDLTDLTRELRRELEWIPLKALRKDPGQRYRSPDQLADDIRNYLAGRPLLAGPEAASYRVRKFIYRHRGAVAAAATVTLALLVGLAGTLWEAREAERRAVALERNTYVANIQMAQAALDFKQIDRVRQRLDACPRSLRGWEWRWLNASIDPCLTPLEASAGKVTWAAYSRDGGRVAIACDDGTARVLDAATGRLISTMSGHAGAVEFAAFSPDGRRLLTGSKDHTARVWDAETGVLRLTLSHDDSVMAGAFSPDSLRIVTGAFDGSILAWDARSGERLGPARTLRRAITCVAFTRDGERIATSSYALVACVWDLSSDAPLLTLTHPDLVSHLALSPDGRRLATSSWDGTVRMWDAGTGASLFDLPGQGERVHTVEFSADGARLVTSAFDGVARVWDIESRKLLHEYPHTAPIDSAVLSPDGTRLLTACRDGIARIWDADAATDPPVLTGHADAVTWAAFSPDGSRIVTASQDLTARVWDPATGRPLLALRPGATYVNCAAYSPDNRFIVTGSCEGLAVIWDADTGARLRELRGHTADVTSVGFSRDGRRIVTASFDHTFRIFDAATGDSTTTVDAHSAYVRSAAFSPDGTRVLTASDDRTARLWDVNGSLIRTFTGHHSLVYGAAFSPDGARVVTASGDQTAIVWEVATGARIATLTGHNDSVTSAAFSPDGSRIVTSSFDHTARIWDASTGAALAELKGHSMYVTSAVFSPDSTRILTTSFDHTARLWDARPYRERLPELTAARDAGARMHARLSDALASGRSFQDAAASLTTDPTLTPVEHTAARATVFEERRRRIDARPPEPGKQPGG